MCKIKLLSIYGIWHSHQKRICFYLVDCYLPLKNDDMTFKIKNQSILDNIIQNKYVWRVFLFANSADELFLYFTLSIHLSEVMWIIAENVKAVRTGRENQEPRMIKVQGWSTWVLKLVDVSSMKKDQSCLDVDLHMIRCLNAYAPHQCVFRWIQCMRPATRSWRIPAQ